MLTDVILPQLGESVAEGTISKGLVREGDVVKKDQPMVSIATDKADSDLPAPTGGRVAKLLFSEGQVVPVKAVIAQIEEGAGVSLSVTPGAPVSIPAPTAAPAQVPAASVRGAMGALATPTVRKAALENDVDLSSVQGTGERGRVTKDDVMRAAGNNDHAQPPAAEARAPAPPPARAQ